LRKHSESRNRRFRLFKLFFSSIKEPNHWVEVFGKNPKEKGIRFKEPPGLPGISKNFKESPLQGGWFFVKEPKKTRAVF
jgi:hypothetical protein